MLGKFTSQLASRPRHWVQRIWGYPDINARQKWVEVWPVLSKFQLHDLSVLDAGCANGEWVLEISARRPKWNLVGLDIDRKSVAWGETARSKLGLKNVRFFASDFLDFITKEKFDVVLSILSAHYLVEQGLGAELFSQFRSWLRQGGTLILLGPRQEKEVPFVSFLPRSPWHEVFSEAQIREFCFSSSLRVETLQGSVGLMGTVAKQLSTWTDGSHAFVRLLIYPFECFFSWVDSRLDHSLKAKTIMWLLIAKAE